MGSEKLGNIRIMGELFKHQIHGNTRPFDHGLARQYPWVCNDSIVVKSRVCFHIQAIIACRRQGTSRLSVSSSSMQVRFHKDRNRAPSPQSKRLDQGVLGQHLPYAADLALPAVFCFEVALRCRFGCTGVTATGASVCSCTAAASGSGDAAPFWPCPLRYIGAFSQGRIVWATCRRRSVVDRAVRGWLRGIPYFIR
jgi:hypothetical protein